MLRDSSLEPRLLIIRNKIWGKSLQDISEATSIPVSLLRLVERNQRKRLTELQYRLLEQYIEKKGW